MPFTIRALLLLSAFAPSVVLANDDTLTLDSALNLARKQNGTIESAFRLTQAAKSRIDESEAAFLPTLTPKYQYNSVRQDGQQLYYTSEGWTGTLAASWTLLDAGQRDFSLRASRRAYEASRYSALSTLRSTLFTVIQQYYDALRAQQLEKVTGSQVDRAKAILEQTDARILVRDAAKIERLQANADYQNAKVQALSARNQVTNAAAKLKATVGLDSAQSLPRLEESALDLSKEDDNLEALLAYGIDHRPDLISQRLSIESEELNRSRAQREAGLTFAVNLNNTYQFTPGGANNRNFSFLASYPLFDGGLLRANVRELSANIASDRALLKQAERSARAEIESAYEADKTNREKLAAAQIALDAARENYRFAVDSRDKGASDLLTVLTAQVSLVTAESDFIQAQYDERIANVQLRLVTGRPIPGDTAS